MDKSDNGGILIQFLAGKAASRVDSVDSNGSPMQVLTDEEAIEESLEALRSVFGHDSVPDPISTKVTRWRQDPYAYGSYSFAKVGATGDMYDEIASPLGNLLFAGEHTSKHAHSTVHGAWSTGQREAKRIVDIVKN
jgi:monoamine oxidase